MYFTSKLEIVIPASQNLYKDSLSGLSVKASTLPHTEPWKG